MTFSRTLFFSLIFACQAHCATTFAGIAVAPNGTIWIARNTAAGLFSGPVAEGIYACRLVGPDLICTKANVRNVE